MQESVRGVHGVLSTMLFTLFLSLDPSIVFERRNTPTNKASPWNCILPLTPFTPAVGVIFISSWHKHIASVHFQASPWLLHLATFQTTPASLCCPHHRHGLLKWSRRTVVRGRRLTLRSCCASLSLQLQLKPLLIGSALPPLLLSHKGAPMSRWGPSLESALTPTDVLSRIVCEWLLPGNSELHSSLPLPDQAGFTL